VLLVGMLPPLVKLVDTTYGAAKSGVGPVVKLEL
jgi:hypothetical protein